MHALLSMQYRSQSPAVIVATCRCLNIPLNPRRSNSSSSPTCQTTKRGSGHCVWMAVADETCAGCFLPAACTHGGRSECLGAARKLEYNLPRRSSTHRISKLHRPQGSLSLKPVLDAVELALLDELLLPQLLQHQPLVILAFARCCELVQAQTSAYWPALLVVLWPLPVPWAPLLHGWWVVRPVQLGGFLWCLPACVAVNCCCTEKQGYESWLIQMPLLLGERVCVCVCVWCGGGLGHDSRGSGNNEEEQGELFNIHDPDEWEGQARTQQLHPTNPRLECLSLSLSAWEPCMHITHQRYIAVQHATCIVRVHSRVLLLIKHFRHQVNHRTRKHQIKQLAGEHCTAEFAMQRPKSRNMCALQNNSSADPFCDAATGTASEI